MFVLEVIILALWFAFYAAVIAMVFRLLGNLLERLIKFLERKFCPLK